MYLTKTDDNELDLVMRLLMPATRLVEQPYFMRGLKVETSPVANARELTIMMDLHGLLGLTGVEVR